MFCVYLLESEKSGELYSGFTTSLKRRLREHNHGENRATKPYLPWKCIYCEYCTNEQDARRREKYLKTSQGRQMIRRRLREHFKNRRVS